MILFVDDELHRIEPYIFEIQDIGLAVTTAHSVSTARKILAGPGPIDLVILDVMLPWGDDPQGKDYSEDIGGGLLLLREIREHNSHLPVVILTSATRTEYLLEHDPATRFCRKTEVLPFEFAILVKELLKGKT